MFIFIYVFTFFDLALHLLLFYPPNSPPLPSSLCPAEVSLVEDDAEYRFTFPTPPDVVSPPILSFTDVSFGYPGGPELFHDLNFG